MPPALPGEQSLGLVRPNGSRLSGRLPVLLPSIDRQAAAIKHPTGRLPAPMLAHPDAQPVRCSRLLGSGCSKSAERKNECEQASDTTHVMQPTPLSEKFRGLGRVGRE